MATKTAAKTTKTYNVTGRVTVDVGIDINASSWESALDQALSLKLENFVELLGDHNDSEPVQITSIYASPE